jgi:hypothetical protein
MESWTVSFLVQRIFEEYTVTLCQYEMNSRKVRYLVDLFTLILQLWHRTNSWRESPMQMRICCCNILDNGVKSNSCLKTCCARSWFELVEVLIPLTKVLVVIISLIKGTSIGRDQDWNRDRTKNVAPQDSNQYTLYFRTNEGRSPTVQSLLSSDSVQKVDPIEV